jgi:hypothetical protein
MIMKTPSDFGSHDDWLADVRREVPRAELPYALALGRMELFRSFYRIQQLTFPARFAEESERIEAMLDPERTSALEDLNDAIFQNLTVHLFNHARLRTYHVGRKAPAFPREQIQELLSHLARENPNYALWAAYKSRVSSRSFAEEWDEYFLEELEMQSAGELAFTLAMVKLDKLLNHFGDKNLPLPSLAFERIRLLHYLQGPERMAQTRAVLGMLTAELGACTSA